MKINTITSTSNPLLKQIRGLHQRHGREKAGLFLVEGQKAVAEAFQKRLSVAELVVSHTYLQSNPQLADEYDVKAVSVVDDKLFADLATTVSPEGVLAVARMPQYELETLIKQQRSPLIVVAHAIQDPGNLGTIIRTALAASASGMILTKGTVDPFNPKVVRSAMGALFALPLVWDIEYATAVAQLKKHRIRTVACEPKARQFYFDVDLREPTALILGNEGQGLSEEDLQAADELVAIPMNPQSESLNVAVSAAIVLFSAVQQRSKMRG